MPVERVDFLMYSHKYRNRAISLSVAVATSTSTTITVADNSNFLMNHDVLSSSTARAGTRNIMQIAADPACEQHADGHPRRGHGQPDQLLATIANGSTVNLIGNSRNGAEVQQTGLTTIGIPRTQYCQTYQFPVQIGGSAQTARAQVMPGGIQSPFDFNMTVQLQNMVDDIENTLYYGVAQAARRRQQQRYRRHGQDERPAVDPDHEQHLLLHVDEPDQRLGVWVDRPDPRHAPGGPVRRRRARLARRVDELHERLRDLGTSRPADPGRRDGVRHADQRARGPVPARRDDRRSAALATRTRPSP